MRCAIASDASRASHATCAPHLRARVALSGRRGAARAVPLFRRGRPTAACSPPPRGAGRGSPRVTGRAARPCVHRPSERRGCHSRHAAGPPRASHRRALPLLGGIARGSRHRDDRRTRATACCVAGSAGRRTRASPPSSHVVGPAARDHFHPASAVHLD
ncbi:unnamed protein product [Lampetra fluviatilis]